MLPPTEAVRARRQGDGDWSEAVSKKRANRKKPVKANAAPRPAEPPKRNPFRWSMPADLKCVRNFDSVAKQECWT